MDNFENTLFVYYNSPKRNVHSNLSMICLDDDSNFDYNSIAHLYTNKDMSNPNSLDLESNKDQQTNFFAVATKNQPTIKKPRAKPQKTM